VADPLIVSRRFAPETAVGKGTDCTKVPDGVYSSRNTAVAELLSAPVPLLPADLSRYQPFLSRLLAKGRGERFASAAEIIETATALIGTATPDLAATGEASAA